MQRFRLVVAAMGLALIFAERAKAEDVKNLILNPGFEQAAKEKSPYFAPPWTNQGECASLATDRVHSGQRAAKIEIKDLAATTRWQNFKMPRIPVSQQPYYFSAWVRTENVKQSPQATYQMARGTLFYQDADGAEIKNRHTDLFSLQGTQEWTLCEKVFTPPPKARTATLYLSLDLCTGAVWFDDVVLRPLGAASESAKKNEEEELKRLQLLQVGHVKLKPRPLGWVLQGEGPSWTTGEGHTGAHGLRISQTAFDEQSVWQLWRCDTVDFPGGPITLSAWAKGANIAPAVKTGYAPSIGVFWLDAAGRALDHKGLSLSQGTFDWKRFEAKFIPPSDAKAFYITVSLSYFTGDLWVDDMQVLDAQGKDLLPNGGVEQPERPPQIVQEAVTLPAQYEMAKEKFPESATNIRVGADGNFTRDGRPVFLVATQEAYETFPWMSRLLGMDVIAINGICPPEPTIVVKRRWGKLRISFREDDYLETELRDVLSHGFAAYAAMTEHGREGDLLFRERPDLFVEGGHYFAYHDADPDGKRLRKNLRLSLLQTTRRYPVFLYELFNEVHYMSYHPAELARFRAEMKAKYADIARANAAWGTRYAAFDEVSPPTKPDCDTRMSWHEDWSVNLFMDWVKYTERRFGEICCEQREIVKGADRNPNANITVQSYILGDFSSHGVHPEEKVKAEDVYGHEEYMVVFKQIEGAEDEKDLLRTLSFGLRADAVAAADRTRPVFNEEAGICSGAKALTPEMVLVDLHGDWRFAEDNKSEGEGKGFAKPDHDDSSWGTITVPGMWGQLGHPMCTVGWYRKTFKVPEYAGPIYLDGAQLTDFADIYLNGELVHKTKRWNEEFCLDVGNKVLRGRKNHLAIRIANNYFLNKMYWGGIRRHIRLSKIPTSPEPVTAGQMRMYLWSSVYHNMGATLFFNTFSPEAYPTSDTNPERMSPAALRAIPSVRQEINALGRLVLPQPRRHAEVALLYTFESQRARIPRDYQEWLSGPMVADLAVYYGGLFFSQIPVDVLLTKDVLRGVDPKYKMLIVAAAPRVNAGIVKPLRDFAEAGGTLVVGPSSMTVDDEFQGAMNCSSLFGANPGKPIEKAALVKPLAGGIPSFKTVANARDGAFGVSLKPQGAAVIAQYEDGSPAITANSVGKGRVYYFAAEMGLRDARGVLTSLAEESGVKPELVVKSEGAAAPFIEAHTFGNPNEQVWYVNNWGAGKRDVMISPAPGCPFEDAASYKVLASPAPNSPLAPLQGKATWTGAEIKTRIRFTVASYEPVVVWIGRNEMAPPDTVLPPTQSTVLERTWVYTKHPVRALVDAAKVHHCTRDKIPSAVALMEEQGVQVDGNFDEIGEALTVFSDKRETAKLSDYALLIIPSRAAPGYKRAEADRIVKFVEQGGGLLICGCFYRGPHGWYSNAAMNTLTDAFGVRLENDSICDPAHNAMNAPRFPLFTQITPHAITQGVRAFQSKGMASLRLVDEKLKPLIVSDPDSYRLVSRWQREDKPSLPAMIALERGKGRVVIMGDGQWMLPDYLPQADNVRLFANLTSWLTHGKARQLDDTAIRNVLKRFEF